MNRNRDGSDGKRRESNVCTVQNPYIAGEDYIVKMIGEQSWNALMEYINTVRQQINIE